MGQGAAVRRYAPWLLFVVLLGAVTTLALLLFVPEKAEFIGFYWVISGLPWSVLIVGGLSLAGLLPDNGYVNPFILVLCTLANVGIVHLLESASLRASKRRVER